MAHFTPPLLVSNPKSQDWTYFARQFANYLLIVNAEEEQQLPLLLNCLGRDGTDIFDGLADPKSTYKEVLQQFQKHFDCRTSVLLKRKAFFEARQTSAESATNFACRLRRLAKDCNFGTNQADLLRDIFVCGVYNDCLGERLLAEDKSKLNFETALAKAEAFERSQHERRKVHVAPTVSAVTSQPSKRLPHSTAKKPTAKCYRCGSSLHLANSPDCPAKTATCKSCHRVGHYQSVCTRGCGQSYAPKTKQVRAVQQIHGSASTTGVTELTDKFLEFNVFATNCSVTDASDVRRQIFVNGYPIDAIIDTGADCNVLPKDCVPHLTLTPTTTTIKAWGNFSLPVLGEVECHVRYKNHDVIALFFVVDFHNMQPLMSLSLSRELDLISELVTAKRPTSPFTSTSQLTCSLSNLQSGSSSTLLPPVEHNKNKSNCTSCTQDIISEFADKGLFTGIGCIKGIQHKIVVDESVTPTSQPARRLPPALRDTVEAKLRQMSDDKIITKVTDPTDWCSPLVVTTKKSGDIRICCDLRSLNKAVKRPEFQIPSFEELVNRINGAEIYTVLDATSAFHQIQVHPDSQHLLTFGTSIGRFAWVRVPYGLRSAPELFQSILTDILCDIPNVLVFFDDILIAAKTISEHDSILRQVLQRLFDKGITLNKEKCQFALPEIDFLGYHLNSAGIAPSPSKIDSIRTMTVPETKEQLRSFLGLATFVGQRFIAHFSSLTAPLFDMCSKSATFEWNKTLLTSFKTLQNAIVNASELVWFDIMSPVTIVSDASGYGLGAALLQNNKVVAYASRKLTAVETRYSCIEREFLGILFALNRFRKLITGIKCDVHTDHKPILALFDKHIDQLPIRIQKWMMHVQAFDIKISHIPGIQNVVADALSRNPCSSDSDAHSSVENTEYTICFLLKNAPIDLKMVAKATSKDAKLQSVIHAISESWKIPNAQELKPYYSFRGELSTKVCSHNDSNSTVICKNNLVLIPNELVPAILEQLHEGHIGSTKMKQMLQAYAFWPGFSKDIDEFVRRCTACTIYQTRSDRPSLTPIADLETAVYEKISIDLTGPSETLKGCTLLTIIDYYSRYPEAYILNNANSSEIISCLTETFARFGVPKVLISDNGSVFVSKEFETFLSSLGITHIRSSNYHPQSNGTIERLHSTLKSRLKRLQVDSPKHVSISLLINKVLFDIRSTPHSVTGETPFQRFFNRPMRTKLTSLADNPLPSVAPTRDVTAEYSKMFKGRNVQYLPGDLVLV